MRPRPFGFWPPGHGIDDKQQPLALVGIHVGDLVEPPQHGGVFKHPVRTQLFFTCAINTLSPLSLKSATPTQLPGAIDNIDFKGSKDVANGYTVRDWVESINDINNPAGSFAGFYDYYDNGNVMKAEFHNPDITLGSAHNRYHWDFTYDNLTDLIVPSMTRSEPPDRSLM